MAKCKKINASREQELDQPIHSKPQELKAERKAAKMLEILRNIEDFADEKEIHREHVFQKHTIWECSCHENFRYCEQLAGADNWMSDDFGCNYSALMSEHFRLDTSDGLPYFKRVFRYPF